MAVDKKWVGWRPNGTGHQVCPGNERRRSSRRPCDSHGANVCQVVRSYRLEQEHTIFQVLS